MISGIEDKAHTTGRDGTAAALSASPAAGSRAPVELTARQWRVVSLMADDLVDSVIASRLDVSIRTVRSEVAAILRALGATSRFGAGIALGRALQRFENRSSS